MRTESIYNKNYKMHKLYKIVSNIIFINKIIYKLIFSDILSGTSNKMGCKFTLCRVLTFIKRS